MSDKNRKCTLLSLTATISQRIYNEFTATETWSVIAPLVGVIGIRGHDCEVVSLALASVVVSVATMVSLMKRPR